LYIPHKTVNLHTGAVKVYLTLWNKELCTDRFRLQVRWVRACYNWMLRCISYIRDSFLWKCGYYLLQLKIISYTFVSII